jgi:hypothetical protein
MTLVSKGCPEEPPAMFLAGGRPRRWRTVDPAIPCQVAPQQSLTLFHRTISVYRKRASLVTKTREWRTTSGIGRASIVDLFGDDLPQRRIVAEPASTGSREFATTQASNEASPNTSPEVIFDEANSAHGFSGERSRDRAQ